MKAAQRRQQLLVLMPLHLLFGWNGVSEDECWVATGRLMPGDSDTALLAVEVGRDGTGPGGPVLKNKVISNV